MQYKIVVYVLENCVFMKVGVYAGTNATHPVFKHLGRNVATFLVEDDITL